LPEMILLCVPAIYYSFKKQKKKTSSSGCGSGGGVSASCHKTSFQRGLMIVREISWGREGLGFMFGIREC